MKKDKRIISGIIFDIFVAIILWFMLITLKAAKVIDMHWALVLSGLVWISWALFALTALAGIVMQLLVKVKHRYQRRKHDRRVVKMAQNLGVWGKPRCLGGRALELKAWEELRIKRKPGETDKELRRRCKSATANAYEASRW